MKVLEKETLAVYVSFADTLDPVAEMLYQENQIGIGFQLIPFFFRSLERANMPGDELGHTRNEVSAVVLFCYSQSRDDVFVVQIGANVVLTNGLQLVDSVLVGL